MSHHKNHPQASMISQQQTIPFISEFDEEEDELYFYHRDTGKEIDVVAYYAPSWDDDETLEYNHVLEIIPAVLDLYEQIKDEPDAEICRIEDFTKEEDSEPYPFMIAAIRNAKDFAD